jgi:phospholipid-binding lipoprotein MlaA
VKKVLPIALFVVFAAVAGSKGPATAASLSAASDQNQNLKTSSGDNFLLSQQETRKESNDESLDFLMEEGAKEEILVVPDPLYYFNKGMFHVNDKLYFWLLKPVARGWRAVIPELFRTGIQNFFYNLRFPQRFISSVLQGKGKKAEMELTRFLLNTTVGIGGLGNPAKKYPELNPSEEDLGQTFAVWGVGNGFYLVIPFFGPSTLRDGLGRLGDIFLDPTYWIGREVDNLWVTVGLWTGETINNVSFRIGDYEAIKEAAIDPYVALRNGYIQNRNKLIEE